MAKEKSLQKFTPLRIDDECGFAVHGPGNLEVSLQIKFQLAGMIEKGCSHLAIHLQHCPYMNSVFVGTLLGLSTRLQEKHQERLVLRGLNETNKRILKTLGVLEWFLLKPAIRLGPIAKKRVKKSNQVKLSAVEHLYEAHLRLMNSSRRNRSRFQSVVKLLQEDLQKLQNRPSTV